MKTWTVDEIKDNLMKSDLWVIRGLLAIYNNQTSDEKSAGATRYENGIGFSGCDSEILSSFAKFYQERKFLSKKQIEIARKRIVKYRKQLVAIANENEQRKSLQTA